MPRRKINVIAKTYKYYFVSGQQKLQLLINKNEIRTLCEGVLHKTKRKQNKHRILCMYNSPIALIC